MKSYLDKEECNINKLNQLEKDKKENIENQINSAYFAIYLLNSDLIYIDNMKTHFINVENEREIFMNIKAANRITYHNTYFIIKNNNTIYVKWRLMNFNMSKTISSIQNEFNINIYSDKEIEGYDIIIADSYKKAYRMEMYENHYKREGYFLYVKDNIISRLAISRSDINIEILKYNLKDLIDDTNALDWKYD